MESKSPGDRDQQAAPSKLRDDLAETQAASFSEKGERVGRKIGNYVLLQKMGEGGMGTVWVAEQSRPVKRRVALKLIRADIRSTETLRRFEAERQALALMDHNNIAKVLDAGETPEGAPYFAMELIRGISITKYCDEMRIDMRERLKLFAQVCDAVQHAHQKGVIHRDLKPSNILVAVQDGVPTPKIIDFGVAKALHQRLSDSTMYTEIGQVIGTLEYMSPEQAELSALDVDTRADIYSLGVILYELCTGSTPLTSESIRSGGILEAIRLIKEVEPVRPSTRLSQTASNLRNVSTNRREDPSRLVAQLRGEVDWIILKALEKDRTRRYESAAGFGNDIRRFLDNEPIHARPASSLYLLRKWMARNKVLATGLICFLGALVFGVLGTSYGFIRAEMSRKEAVAQREQAVEQRKESERLKDLATEQQKIAVAAKDEADRQRELVVEQITKVKGMNNQMRGLLDSFISPSMVEVLSRQETIDPRQRQVLSGILEQYELVVAAESDGEESIENKAHVFAQIGSMHSALKNFPASGKAYERSTSLWQMLVAKDPSNQTYNRRLASSQMGLGVAQLHEIDKSNAEASFVRSIELYESLRDYQDGDEKTLRRCAQVISNLAVCYRSKRQYEKCAEIQEKSIAIGRRVLLSNPDDRDFQDALAWALWSAAENLNSLKEFDTAESYLRESVDMFRKLVTKNPKTSLYRSNLTKALNSLAATLVSMQNFEEAEAFYEDSLYYLRRITSEFPGKVEYKSLLCDVLEGSGSLALRSGNETLVKERVVEGVAAIESIQQGAISNDINEEITSSSSKLGSLALNAGLHEQAFQLFSKVAKLSSGNNDDQNQVWMSYCLVAIDRIDEAKLDSPELLKDEDLPALVLYNKACVYSRAYKTRPEDQSFRSNAERFLKKSIQGGYSDFENIMADTDLDAIKEGDSFRLWVKEYQSLNDLILNRSYGEAIRIVEQLEHDSSPAFKRYCYLYLALLAKSDKNDELRARTTLKLRGQFDEVKSSFDRDRVLKSCLLLGMDANEKGLSNMTSQLEKELDDPTWGPYYALSVSWAKLKMGNHEAAARIACKSYPNEQTVVRLTADWVAMQANSALGRITEAKNYKDRYALERTEFESSVNFKQYVGLDWFFMVAMTEEMQGLGDQ